MSHFDQETCHLICVVGLQQFPLNSALGCCPVFQFKKQFQKQLKPIYSFLNNCSQIRTFTFPKQVKIEIVAVRNFLVYVFFYIILSLCEDQKRGVPTSTAGVFQDHLNAAKANRVDWIRTIIFRSLLQREIQDGEEGRHLGKVTRVLPQHYDCSVPCKTGPCSTHGSSQVQV